MPLKKLSAPSCLLHIRRFGLAARIVTRCAEPDTAIELLDTCTCENSLVCCNAATDSRIASMEKA